MQYKFCACSIYSLFGEVEDNLDSSNNAILVEVQEVVVQNN